MTVVAIAIDVLVYGALASLTLAGLAVLGMVIFWVSRLVHAGDR